MEEVNHKRETLLWALRKVGELDTRLGRVETELEQREEEDEKKNSPPSWTPHFDISSDITQQISLGSGLTKEITISGVAKEMQGFEGAPRVWSSSKAAWIPRLEWMNSMDFLHFAGVLGSTNKQKKGGLGGRFGNLTGMEIEMYEAIMDCVRLGYEITMVPHEIVLLILVYSQGFKFGAGDAVLFFDRFDLISPKGACFARVRDVIELTPLNLLQLPDSVRKRKLKHSFGLDVRGYSDFTEITLFPFVISKHLMFVHTSIVSSEDDPASALITRVSVDPTMKCSVIQNSYLPEFPMNFDELMDSKMRTQYKDYRKAVKVIHVRTDKIYEIKDARCLPQSVSIQKRIVSRKSGRLIRTESHRKSRMKLLLRIQLLSSDVECDSALRCWVPFDSSHMLFVKQ